MTTSRQLALGIAGAALATAALAPAVRADFRFWQQPAPAPRRAATFDVSGVYKENVAGQIVIDDVAYRISPAAQVYLVGEGSVSLNAVAAGSHVFASGSGTAESGLIVSLIARPPDEDAGGGGDPASHLSVRPVSMTE
jgi:hypothetical protein